MVGYRGLEEKTLSEHTELVTRKYKKLRGVSTQPFTATGLTEFYSTYQIESQISIHQELLQSLPENIRTIKHRIIS